MIYNKLILLVLVVPLFAQAQTADPPPVSPLAATMERAREAARADDADAAVAELQKMADAGFTSVGVITGDEALSLLAGDAGYDKLVADMSRLAYPCEYDDQFKEFDFWLGKWIVHTASGQHAGYNEIIRAERGCVLLEDWANVSGGGGGSINYVDKVTGEWVQVWNDASGSQINIRGGLTDEGMLLVGTLHSVGTGVTVPFRGLWTDLPDGRVRQFFEQSNDGGETWVTWFDGYYTRQEEQDQ
jgi:hypothetical protein